MSELPELVGISGAARIAGLSKQRMSLLVLKEDFPKVAYQSEHGRLWRREDVERWAKTRRKGRGW